MAISLCVLLSFAQFFWVSSTVTHDAAPYLRVDVETFVKRRRLLLLGPLFLGIILAISVIALRCLLTDIIDVTVEVQPNIDRHAKVP